MNPQVGDEYTVASGEGLRITELNPGGDFLAQVRSIKTGEWTNYYLRGEAAKLGDFLEARGAVKDNEL